MKPTITIPKAEAEKFQRDLAKLSEYSSRNVPDFLNAKAYFIIRAAQDATVKASREKIEALGLKTTRISERMDSKGKVRRRRTLKLSAKEAVGNYIASLIRKKGKGAAMEFVRTFENRQALEHRARKWISSKFKAIGFLKSIWRPTLASLSRFAGRRYAGRDRNVDPFAAKHSNIFKMLQAATKGRLRIDFGTRVGADAYGVELAQSQQSEARRSFAAGWQKEAIVGTAKRLEEKIKESLKQGGFTVR